MIGGLLAILSCAGSGDMPPVQADETPSVSTPEPPAPAPPAPPAPVPPSLAPADLSVPADPAALAARLVVVESTLRDPRHAGTVLDTWGHLQQRLYRAIGQDPALPEQVRASLPTAWHDTLDRVLAATRDAASTVRGKRSRLPAWSIVAPLSAEALEALYRETEEATGVPWTILAAIHLVETRCGRLRGVSPAGARGPMQFMPATWKAYGEGDIEDDRDAIFAAGRYLKAMGAETDLDGALWAYNNHNSYVASVRAYAAEMDANRLAYRGFHGWQVYYKTTRGSVWLPVGYEQETPLAVDAYCQSHPARCPAP